MSGIENWKNTKIIEQKKLNNLHIILILGIIIVNILINFYIYRHLYIYVCSYIYKVETILYITFNSMFFSPWFIFWTFYHTIKHSLNIFSGCIIVHVIYWSCLFYILKIRWFQKFASHKNLVKNVLLNILISFWLSL